MNALATAGAMAMRPGAQRLSPTALALVLLAHIAVLFALLATQGISVPQPASALMVSLVQAQTTSPQAAAPPAHMVTATPKSATQSPQQGVQPTAVSSVLASESPQVVPAFEAAAPRSAPALAPSANANTTANANANANGTATLISTANASASTQTQAPSAPRLDADYLDNPAPVYPPLSWRGAEQGTVMLRVYVEASGQAAKVELRSSSGYERLDRAAIAAVSHWKFVPARQGADAVAAWVVVPIVFSLKV